MHSEYGEQFKIETFEKVMPEDAKSLEKYLASGVIKGVGKATAKRIVDRFKDETIHVLKFEPDKLALVKGISREKAENIVESFNAEWELWQIVKFLEQFGIGANNANKVYKKLGQTAIEQIEANPYILLDIVYGVNFKEVDKMGLKLGIEAVNEQRIQCGIKYAITLVTLNGHTCVLKSNLLTFVKELLNVEKDVIENNLIELKLKQEIVLKKINEEEWVYLYPFYKAEKNIAEKIMDLKNARNKTKIKNIKTQLEKVQQLEDIILSEEQKEAVEKVIQNNVCIITGGPGTGKTTIIKTIINLYNNNKLKIILAAPTGRAAKRMTESSGYEAKTLHRVLELGKQLEEDILSQVDYELKPLDADIVIVDEMSMVDIFLMNNLLKAMYNGTKLVLVGDVDQLPSVGPGSVLNDLIESEKIETVKLNKIFRQAKTSKIILNAHKVNSGEKLLTKADNNVESETLRDDFFFIKEVNQEKCLNQIITLCTDRLKDYGNYDFFKDIQVLSATKKGMLGTKELNKYLQTALNKKDSFKEEKNYGQITFRQGDKVMQIKNNYDIVWEKVGQKQETGTGVFNGDLGIIKQIDNKNNVLTVVFDDNKEVMYQYSELDQLEHSYVTTIHKSQGSEFNVVILVIPNAAPMLLTRNLLYTGITRAKELLVLIGSQKTIDFMIQNSNVKKRNTGLKDNLQNSVEYNF